MRKLVSFIAIALCLFVGTNMYAQSGQEWLTSKSDAISQAKAQGKKVLLMYGRATCGNCNGVKRNCQNAEVATILSKSYVLWFHNCDDRSNVSDVSAYLTGLTSIQLPFMAIISPSDAGKAISTSTSYKSVDQLKTFLNSVAASSSTVTPATGTSNSTSTATDHSVVKADDDHNCQFKIISGGEVSVRLKEGVHIYGALVIPAYVEIEGKKYAVTEIEESGFIGQCGMISLSIPNTVKTIGNSAFYWCSRVTSITIPDGVESIGRSAFSATFSATSITIGKGLKVIEPYVFSSCKLLESIVIPSTVEQIEAFAFASSPKLKSIKIMNPETIIGEGIMNTTEWYESQPNGIVYLDNIAYGYKGTAPASLAITIKEGTTIIADKAFMEIAKSITSVQLPSTLKIIGKQAFCRASNLTQLTLPNSVVYVGGGAFSGTAISSLKVGSSVKYIGSNAFDSCPLTTLSLPKSLSVLDACAFSNCNKLEQISIDLGNKNFKVVDNFVYSVPDNGLIMVIPSAVSKEQVVADGVTSIANKVFSYTSVVDVTLPASLHSIGKSTFIGCMLNSINVSENSKNFYSNGTMLYNRQKDSLKLCVRNVRGPVVVPDGVRSIGDSAFYYCNNITRVTLPASLNEIGHGAFSSCSKLDSVVLPKSIVKIGDYTFNSCVRMSSIVLPQGLLSIGISAFLRCRKLGTIVIPSSVKSICSYAFSNCEGLKEVVVCCKSPIDIDKTVFYGIKCENIMLIVPTGSKEAYAAHPYWKAFTNIVEKDLKQTDVPPEEQGEEEAVDGPVFPVLKFI